MAGSVRFVCTALAGTEKKGILTPDENGYYTQVVGGLNVFNSIGHFYVYDEARALFEKSSHLMRRIQQGLVGSELGHPKFLPGMTEQDFMRRLASIYEENICGYICELYLDFDNYKDVDGRPIIAIVAKIRPDGPHGASLKAGFENPKQNVCFSIRSFTENFERRGIIVRVLREVITFDRVTEPGISIANKYSSKSLENYQFANENAQILTPVNLEAMVDFGVTAQSLKDAFDNPKIGGFGMESVVIDPKQLIRTLGLVPKGNKAPEWLNW